MQPLVERGQQGRHCGLDRSAGGQRGRERASLLLLALLAATAPPAPGHRPATPVSTSACRLGETAIVVDTTAHRLYLCAGGAAERSFPVALGVNGVEKRRTGDNRTPLGIYALGTPRASGSFHRFVPVAYPTPAQARAGFTGSAIGIHGPPRHPGGRRAAAGAGGHRLDRRVLSRSRPTATSRPSCAGSTSAASASCVSRAPPANKVARVICRGSRGETT